MENFLNKYYTYQLVDSSDDQTFYVGKGCENRMFKHEKDVRLGKIPNKTNYKLYHKIKKLIDRGVPIRYEKLIENVGELEALALESALIEYYGIDNLCNYFKSWSGKSLRSEKTRIKQSLANKGSKSYMYGKPKTDEQKLKNKLAHMGKNNVRYIHKKYNFYNHELNLVENMTPYEFREKYKVDSGGLHRLLKGEKFSIKGWTLGIEPKEIENDRINKIKQKLTGKPKSREHRKNLWKNRKKT